MNAGGNQASFSSSQKFDFFGVYLTAAFVTPLTVTVAGFDDAAQKYSETVTLNSLTDRFYLSVSWANITRVTFDTSGSGSKEVAVDNIFVGPATTPLTPEKRKFNLLYLIPIIIVPLMIIMFIIFMCNNSSGGGNSNNNRSEKREEKKKENSKKEKSKSSKSSSSSSDDKEKKYEEQQQYHYRENQPNQQHYYYKQDQQPNQQLFQGQQYNEKDDKPFNNTYNY